MKRAVIYISFIHALLFFGSSTVLAFEVSSKRECAICHIMWLDDFRTDKETLVEWQPGNVLMKDTQGVVSSEEICYSCHDGYVSDSRADVWKYNSHAVYVSPSNKVDVPLSLTLSNKDQIYCGTCHSAHGSGAAPSGSSGLTSFFREKNIDSSLCEMCHKDKADYRKSNSHPLHMTSFVLPEDIFANGAKQATEKNKLICQSCHKVHGAKGKKILITENNKSSLCIFCHITKESLLSSKHDLQTTAANLKNINDQNAMSSGPCSACHTPHNSLGKRLWARRVDTGNPVSGMCLSCHGQSSGIKNIKNTGEHSHPVNVVPESFSESGDMLLFSKETGQQGKRGKVECLTCHDAHRWSPVSTTDRGGANVEGDASNSFLRVSNILSGLCVKCHENKKQVITTDHNLVVTAPGEKNIQNHTANESGPCGACHIPHNAVNKTLWAKKIENDSNMNMCLSCHGKESVYIKKTVGDFTHPANVQPSEMVTIPKVLPLYPSGIQKNTKGFVQCSTCHNVHVWSPENVFDNHGKNIEGDASNSFLRISNSKSSTLCLDCHIRKDTLITSDHNLEVTASNEKNIQGQTPIESGPCSACHVPHNAESKKLWSRTVSKKIDIVTELCVSCHNSNGVAKEKTIGDHYHPVDVTLKNLNLGKDDKLISEVLPLFDKDANLSKDAHMVCITCHDPHNWVPGMKEPFKAYEFKNIEGDATTSFLRKANFPSSDLCKVCHLDNSLVDGTLHDMNVTAPESVNLLNQTVKESGQCGACHLVHNSPNRLKLWARPYGKLEGKESLINGLCRSCHSKNNVGENKIPLTAMHPNDKLINNIMRYNKRKSGYTPMYDSEGNETSYGNISCPSCHNAHIWSPFSREKGDGIRREGDAMNSFLRNPSSNIICIDCHGSESLWRYNYFHLPNKRKSDRMNELHLIKKLN